MAERILSPTLNEVTENNLAGTSRRISKKRTKKNLRKQYIPDSVEDNYQTRARARTMDEIVRQMAKLVEQQDRRMTYVEENLVNIRGNLHERQDRYKLHMAVYKDEDDIEDFLTKFEGKMKLAQISEDYWVEYLTEVISGRADEACREINYENASYNDVKRQLLKYFNVTAASQRKRLQRYRARDAKTPEEYARQSFEEMANP